MRRILPYILGTLTQHDREIVDLELYPESWTGTAFRIFEYIFGRKAGIRRYNAVEWIDGVRYVKFFCFEAVICYAEVLIRETLEEWKFAPIRIVYATTAKGVSLPFPYLFAIAADTTTNFGLGTGTTTNTYANYPMAATASGALFFGMYGVNGASDTVTGQTFNSTGGTKVNVRVSGYRQAYLFYFLGATVTGTHNIVITFSADPGGSDGAGFSYTGCSSTIDSTATNAVSAASISLTTTVVAANCWLAGFALDNTGGTGQTAGTGTRRLQTGGNYSTFDSNGTVGTGSQSLVVNESGGGVMGGCVASFAPLVATSSGFLAFF